MTTATILGDNVYVGVPRETGSYGKAAPESSGDSPQQRFADVLPLAQTALETPAEKGKAEKGPVKDGSFEEQLAAESSSLRGRPAQKKAETTTEVTSEVAGWLLVGAVPPMMRRQTGAGSGVMPVAKTAGSSAQVAASPEKTASPEQAIQPPATAQEAGVAKQPSPSIPQALQAAKAEAVPAKAQKTQETQQAPPVQQAQQPQQAQEAAAAEQSAGAAVGANVAASTAPEGRQSTPSVAVKGQVPPPQAPQGTMPAAVAPTAPRGGQTGQTQGPKEQTQNAPGPQEVRPAVQSDGEEPPALLKSTMMLNAQVGMAEEKAGQGQGKPQVVNPQPTVGVETPAGSEKSSQGREPSADGRQDRTSKRSTAASNGDLKVESVPIESKDIPLAGPKETGAVMAEARVSSVGESGAVSQRPAMQAQNQASPDVAPARSPVQSVGEQILDSMQVSATRGDRQVLIRLQPPELGTVLVRFQEHGDQLTGTVEVSNREARREIEQALPQVVRSLQESGVQIRRVEVVTSEQSDKGPGGDHLPHDTGAQHQGAGQSREHAQASAQMRWPRGAGEPNVARPPSVPDEPRTSVPPGRIDLLL